MAGSKKSTIHHERHGIAISHKLAMEVVNKSTMADT
jgi:hypothetical protein